MGRGSVDFLLPVIDAGFEELFDFFRGSLGAQGDRDCRAGKDRVQADENDLQYDLRNGIAVQE